jgi:hypothetical protein
MHLESLKSVLDQPMKITGNDKSIGHTTPENDFPKRAIFMLLPVALVGLLQASLFALETHIYPRAMKFNNTLLQGPNVTGTSPPIPNQGPKKESKAVLPL